MKFSLALVAFVLLNGPRASAGGPPAADEYRQLTNIDSLPVALDPDFTIRKAKAFYLGDLPGQKSKRTASITGGTVRDPAVGFEGSYRLFGAVTELDKRRRWGNYYDFFWRGKRDAPITIRLEYQQEKLRAFMQAREVAYAHGRGSHKTSFAILGDDFFNDGRVTAWRCLLIANGHIVAQHRSFLWRDEKRTEPPQPRTEESPATH